MSLTDRNEVSRLMAETQRHLDSLGQVNMRPWRNTKPRTQGSAR